MGNCQSKAFKLNAPPTLFSSIVISVIVTELNFAEFE